MPAYKDRIKEVSSASPDKSGAQARQAGGENPYAGRPLALPSALKARIRHSFGLDADRLSLRESATVAGEGAVAQGDAIRFEPGMYDPHSPAGLAVLGHELAHVRQQAAGEVSHTGTSAHEATADTQGAAFAAGTLAAQGPAAVAAGSAHGAPAQGLFGFGSWRKKRAQKRQNKKEAARLSGLMHTDARQKLELQRGREEGARRRTQRKALMDPRLHPMVEQEGDLEHNPLPTYSLQQQGQVIEEMKRHQIHDHHRLKNTRAFSYLHSGQNDITERFGEFDRRVEALYRMDEEGGIGKNKAHNQKLMESYDWLRRNIPKNKGALELDDDRLADFVELFRDTLGVAREYQGMSGDEVRAEARDNYHSYKDKAGSLHAMSDTLQYFSPQAVERVLREGGWQGTRQDLKEMLDKMSLQQGLGQKDISQGMGLGSGLLSRETSFSKQEIGNAPMSALEKKAMMKRIIDGR